MATVEKGMRLSLAAMGVNLVLAAGKTLAGIFGHSNALVADGIESTADVFSSLVVWGGLRVAVKPADADHPFGHGKAEPVAAIVVSLLLLGAALLIAVGSVREMSSASHLLPAWYTLPVLLGVIAVKETLYRLAFRTGSLLGSTALRSDAWHHRSDALTSAAAFVGISVALIGGPGYESADDIAALLACAVIGWNGLRLLRNALDEVMDASVGPDIVRDVRRLALEVDGVVGVEKCRVRKTGLNLSLDIHVEVDGGLTVREGHEIAHVVKDRLTTSTHRINDVTVHIEPAGGPAGQDVPSAPSGDAPIG